METTINNEFVDYQTALRLKAAGFDEPCEYYYTKEDAPEYCVWLTCSAKFPHDYNQERDWNEPKPICSAPHLWQAQKWLREKKNIEVNAFWCFEDNSWVGFLCPMNMPAMESEPNVYNSYEEALSKSINAALDLIKPEKK